MTVDAMTGTGVEGTAEPEGFVYQRAICPGLNPGRAFSACDGVGGGRNAAGDTYCRTCGATFKSRDTQLREFIEAREREKA